MAIAKDSYVRFNYIFSNANGDIIFESPDDDQPWYVHGHNLILPVFERNLEGSNTGDKLTFQVEPEEGFGPYRENLASTIPKANLPEGFEPEMDAMLMATHEDGQQLPVRITKIDEDTVTIDANHPFAGQTLTCYLMVQEERPATEQELMEITRCSKCEDSGEGDGVAVMEFGPDGVKTEWNPGGGCSGCHGGSCGDDNDGGSSCCG